MHSARGGFQEQKPTTCTRSLTGRETTEKPPVPRGFAARFRGFAGFAALCVRVQVKLPSYAG